MNTPYEPTRDDRTRGELEDAHRDENLAARRRIEHAEESVAYYRSRMTSMQESFYAFAARNDAANDPEFRTALQNVTDEIDHNVREASAAIARLEEDHQVALARQSRELDDHAQAQRAKQHATD
ncbi:hypothetical protein ACI2IX_06345 [Leifsonia aquatica]|uniref:hypothetical protein n=1 Tax=Leifsonia aquatica TaxID=144185 RepID=UPI00384E1FA5